MGSRTRSVAFTSYDQVSIPRVRLAISTSPIALRIASTRPRANKSSGSSPLSPAGRRQIERRSLVLVSHGDLAARGYALRRSESDTEKQIHMFDEFLPKAGCVLP